MGNSTLGYFPIQFSHCKMSFLCSFGCSGQAVHQNLLFLPGVFWTLLPKALGRERGQRIRDWADLLERKRNPNNPVGRHEGKDNFPMVWALLLLLLAPIFWHKKLLFFGFLFWGCLWSLVPCWHRAECDLSSQQSSPEELSSDSGPLHFSQL